MKQYCRYCAHLCVNNFPWCGAKEKALTESYTKTVNRCKHFCFVNMDAYAETKGYKPRERKIPNPLQFKLED